MNNLLSVCNLDSRVALTKWPHQSTSQYHWIQRGGGNEEWENSLFCFPWSSGNADDYVTRDIPNIS